MRGIVIGTIVACIVLIGGAVFFTISNSGSGPRIIPLDKTYTDRVSQGYWKKGSDNPKVVLTEYLDFQCPGCAAASSLIDEAVIKTNDSVQFRVHIYPITSIHDKAQNAARAAEAAGRQGKFWDMHSILFAKQKSWDVETPSQFLTTLNTYAESLALNMDQFKQDMKDSSLDNPITKDQALAAKIPIQSTPTFLIDDKVITSFPPNADELVKLLNDTAAAKAQ